MSKSPAIRLPWTSHHPITNLSYFMLHRRVKHWSQTLKVILSLKLYLFLFADVADPRSCSTFSYFSVFIIPEVATGQQTNLAKVPVTCSFLRSCFRAGHETLQEMCCVTKPGLWGTPFVLLIWQCCAEFNFRVILTFWFFRDDKVDDEDDASESEGTCSVLLS